MGFLEITRKDLTLLVRDRRALVVLLLLPMAFICILGLSTGRLLGWRNDNQLLKLGVVDNCKSRHSGLVIERMQSIDGIKTVRVASLAQLEEQLSDRDLTAAVVIGESFQSKVDVLNPRDIFDISEARMKIALDDVDIRILSRPAGAMVQSVVDQLVLFCTLQAVLPDSARRSEVKSKVADLLLGNSSTEPDERDSSEDSDAETNPNPAVATGQLDATAATETKNGDDSTEPGNPVYQTVVPAYTVMFAFFLVPIMGRSFIAERELGTLRRLRIAPISAVDLVLGKTIPFLVISLAQSAALFLFGRLLFGMSWGSQPWLLFPIVACTSLSATGMGLLIATLVRTDSQVSAYANFLVITLAGISGCFMPRDWLPEMMQTVSLGTPHAWSLIAYHEALTDQTPDVAEIAKACGVLTTFAVTLAAFGCWKMQYSRD
ncbi:MAG: ABC-2 type transport system permease protein [Planctomycetaceae bacterium]|jgi:ABC-2 type transport system permease protein